jgi:hypothetical protein
MTYHQAFDRLGNQARADAHNPRSARLHHAIQATAWTVATVCACALIWMR